MGFDNIVVETDCANLRKNIVNPAIKYNWSLETLLHDIHYLHLCFNSCTFNLTPRSHNKVADWIAKKALSGSLPLNWDLSNQPEMASLLVADLS